MKCFIKSFFFILWFGYYPSISVAQEINAMHLLEAIDTNLWSKTKYINGHLIIDNGRRVRSLEVDTWMEGVDKSYSFYKSPPREKGTQMLKMQNLLI